MHCTAGKHNLFQLEHNVEFHEFLEVHKSKTNKSAWGNDIVLPASEKRPRKKDRSSRESRSCDAEEQEAAKKTGARKVEQKKKLSDLEVSGMLCVRCSEKGCIFCGCLFSCARVKCMGLCVC